jgi:hypothetical protein
VWSLRDLDLGALGQQHPDRNLQSPPGWVHDTDRPIFALRSAKDLQGSTMKRMKGVEDLNIGMIRAQGIVGVGAITHMRTSSHRAAASRWTDNIGSPAVPASFSPSGCSLACSAACSCSRSQRRTKPGSCNSSVIALRWPIAASSPRIWRPYARSSGSSMPSVRLVGLRPCWPICRATPTASPLPIAGSLPSTVNASLSTGRITGPGSTPATSF